MAHSEPAVLAIDRAAAYERRGIVLRTLAGLFMIEVFLTSSWIWMGVRSGSYFWVWLDVFFGALGLVLLGAAQAMDIRAVGLMAASLSRDIHKGEFGYSAEEEDAA